jgi:hypothetical protein
VAVVEQHVDQFVLGGAELLDRHGDLGEYLKGVRGGAGLGHGVQSLRELVGEPAELDPRYRHFSVHVMGSCASCELC